MHVPKVKGGGRFKNTLDQCHRKTLSELVQIIDMMTNRNLPQNFKGEVVPGDMGWDNYSHPISPGTSSPLDKNETVNSFAVL